MCNCNYCLLHLLSCRTPLLLHSQQARVGYGRNQVWALSHEARDLGGEAAAVVIDSTVAAATIAAVATACALQIDLTDATLHTPMNEQHMMRGQPQDTHRIARHFSPATLQPRRSHLQEGACVSLFHNMLRRGGCTKQSVSNADGREGAVCSRAQRAHSFEPASE